VLDDRFPHPSGSQHTDFHAADIPFFTVVTPAHAALEAMEQHLQPAASRGASACCLSPAKG